MKKRILIITFSLGVLVSQVQTYMQIKEFAVHLHALELLLEERADLVASLHKINIDLLKALAEEKE